MKNIEKIKKLAQKKGTPLINFSQNKKFSVFTYQTAFGVRGFSYPAYLASKAMRYEIKRLGG